MAYFNPYEQFGGGAAAGYGAGQTFGNPGGRFEMSNANVFGAVGTGALQGAAVGGPVGAAIGGVVGGVTSVFKQDRQLKESLNNVDTEFNVQHDIYGRPIFNGQEMSTGLHNLSEIGKAVRPGAKSMLPRRRRQMEKKFNDLSQGIQANQDAFNNQTKVFNEQQAAMNQFRRLSDNTNRIRNLYSIGTSLY